MPDERCFIGFIAALVKYFAPPVLREVFLMDISAPKSFSNIGRTADAASKRSGKVHVHKKMQLQPWDGLDLVEQILSEANGNAAHNGREQLRLSSPRVNPVLQDKAVYEGSSSALSSFLASTAKSIVNLPAAAVAQSDSLMEEEDANIYFASSKGRGRLPPKGVKPSPSFLSGPRPDPANASHAPAVGKYLPKYRVIERRAPTPVIGRISRKKPRGPAVSTQSRAATADEQLTASHSDGLLQSTALDGSGVPSPRHAASQEVDPTAPVVVYRKHNVRDCSSAFRSNTPRGELVQSVDLSYWPLPTNGATTYSAGAFHGNARERSYTPFGTPQGTKANYNVVDQVRPASSLNFSYMVNREGHHTRLLYPAEDTTKLNYNPDDRHRSDRHSSKAHYSMSQQTMHPAARSPAPGDEMGPYAQSMVTSSKRGFVDIRRMVGRATEFALDDSAKGKEVLHINYSHVERVAPVVAVARTGRETPGPGRTTPNIHDFSYDANDNSVRRHRPQCVFPRGGRSTFVVQSTCKRQEPYETQDVFHVSNIDFAKQISRDIRDKRFEFK